MDLSNILATAKGYIRLLLSLILLLGSIGSNPYFITSNMYISEEIFLAVTVAGGCLVAISLLLSGSSKEDFNMAEMLYAGIYTILSLAAFVVFILYLHDKESQYQMKVGLFLLGIALCVGIVLWAVLMALAIKDLFC